ncbi:MAG TPA: ankyrin repeat domain-containing protein [Acidobacteriaceae bacterium]
MSDAVPLPPRPDLDHYKKLAKELLRASAIPVAQDAVPDTVHAWALRWLEANARLCGYWQDDDGVAGVLAYQADAITSRWLALRKKRGAELPLLADAQFFLAREHGFSGWPKFAEHVRALESAQSTVANFEAAVEAIIAGDERILGALLRQDPSLVKARSLREHRSTLLHYCSANGVEDYRQRTPANIVAVARMLLDAGAEVNAESDAYGGQSTTLMLTATSFHPERAGVQRALMELLLDCGAAIDVGKSTDVAVCLHNGRGRAAELLASRGARLDLEGAAGIGALNRVKEFFAEDGELRPPATAQQLADGFGWACEFGRVAVVEFLLSQGARADATSGTDGVTPLHWAALCGQPEIVRMLLVRGADVNARETRYGGTPVSWAVYGSGHHDGTSEGKHFYEVVDLLVAAGAEIGSIVSADKRMMAALLGESSR